MLIFDGVWITLGDFTLSADLSIRPGTLAAVMGPSGAGKSTLLAAVAGFQPLDQGRIHHDGARIDRTPPARRPVAMLFQDNNLFPHLTIAQNAALGLSPNGRPGAEGLERIAQALSDVGLNGLGDRKPAHLSGGQQSRAALARAMLQDRPILLLDEPFAALGPALKAEMVTLVRRLALDAGRTVLMVTHDPADAEALGGDILLVLDGAAHPPRPAVRVLEDPPPGLSDYLGRNDKARPQGPGSS